MPQGMLRSDQIRATRSDSAHPSKPMPPPRTARAGCIKIRHASRRRRGVEAGGAHNHSRAQGSGAQWRPWCAHPPRGGLRHPADRRSAGAIAVLERLSATTAGLVQGPQQGVHRVLALLAVRGATWLQWACCTHSAQESLLPKQAGSARAQSLNSMSGRVITIYRNKCEAGNAYILEDWPHSVFRL